MFELLQIRISHLLVHFAFCLGGPGAIIDEFINLVPADQIHPEYWFERVSESDTDEGRIM